MFVVDTNVLVYAADRSCAEHQSCRSKLDEWRRDSLPWYLTWNIIYEFVRVVSHPRVFRRPWPAPQAWAFVEVLLSSPGLGILHHTHRHPAIGKLILTEGVALRGNLIHDVHTAALMREHGIRRIYTRDSDFHKFPFLEVVDPLV
ncbi:MAG: PIN domain-containing protein [Gammaproteobacteria bacterium]|nr:PIN domain-containing protein [Gammaproteobacteria bacterium]MDJ0872432.1 PIN domain-containing protein [Gammaproteobacteria bacterium]MDJ0890516.1 PIN domain-containing protein [Gammaproteobacteria bacterium]